MKNTIILLFLMLLFGGCVKRMKEKTDVGVPVITVNLPYNHPKIDLKDIANNLSFIRLETNGNCLLRPSIRKVEIFNNKIFIFDSSNFGNLYCFDIQGKFLFKVGTMGNGPGEYVFLSDYILDKENKCLWLGDDARKILKYDLDGKFITQYATDFSIKNLWILNEKENIMAIQLGYYKDKNYSFIIYSINDKKILYQKESKNINVIRNIGFNAFSKSNEKILYAEPFNDTIFTVTKEGMLPYYAIDFGKRKLSQELFDNNPQLKNIIVQFNNPDNQLAGLISNPMEAANCIFFGYDFSGEAHFAIYSIESKKLTSIQKISFLGKSFDVSGSFFHIKQDKQFISFLPAHLLAEEGKLKEQQQGYGRYSDISKLIPVLREDDNPIMVIGELNIEVFK